MPRRVFSSRFWCLLLLQTAVQVLLQAESALASSGSSSGDVPDTTVIIDAANAPWTFVPVGADNVTTLVLHDEQPWVIYFHDGFVYEPFREIASQLRGLIRFGVVHRGDRQVTELLKFDPSAAMFRALPFGSEELKMANFLDTDVFDAAVSHASDSVPDDSIVRLTGEESLKRLLTQGVNSTPSKFTVIFTIRDSTPTLLHRVLSRKLSRTFNFGLLTRASPEQPLDGLGLAGVTAPVPGLLVVQARRDGGSLDVARMDESGVDVDSAEQLVFAEVLRYLVEFNRQFRRDLPGDSQADVDAVLRMTDVLDRERLAFRIVDWSDLRRGGSSGGGRGEL